MQKKKMVKSMAQESLIYRKTVMRRKRGRCESFSAYFIFSIKQENVGGERKREERYP